jgi:xylulokinase
MREAACLLGIDVGGTAVKVGLFALDGRLLGLQATSIPVDSPRPGWAEIDARRWLAAIPLATNATLSQAGMRPEQVAAIGLSAMIGTVTPLDAAGHPLRPAIAYFDTRSADEAAWMLEQAPEIPQVTGNRVISGNTSLASILWMRRHEPDIYARAATFATTNTLLFHWLTGERRVDWTAASFMGLFDFRSMDWGTALAAKLGFDLRRLAPVSAPHSTAPLSGRAAALMGLPAGIPVALGGLDGAMSSVGVGAIIPGDAFDVSGTSEMIAVCLPEPVICPELLTRWHVVPGVWTLIGAISTPGAALQWFRDKLYAPGVQADSQELYEAMTAEAASSPPGANGVVFLPHMMGERAPIWDPHARGVFFGLSLTTSRGDMIRAILEGAAYAMGQLIDLIQGYSGMRIRRVVAIGGAARNPLWRQIKADVWGIELLAPPVREATVLGAALTGGVGAGLYADYADAVRRAVPAGGEVTSPDVTRREAYGRQRQVYQRLYPALAESMRYAAAGSDAAAQ